MHSSAGPGIPPGSLPKVWAEGAAALLLAWAGAALGSSAGAARVKLFWNTGT